MDDILDKYLDESVRYISSKISSQPLLAIILGSGLGQFASSFRSVATIDAPDIPHYPHPTVQGHNGELLFGTFEGKSVLAFRGRIHYYESGNLFQALYPVYIAKRLGVQLLLLTNAAGAIHAKLKPGDLMLLRDHVNMTFIKFPPHTFIKTTKHAPMYDERLRKMIRQSASQLNITLKEGVYCGLKGPSYETAAEIRMLRKLGADAVGMSTVNEATLAYGLGMRVAGISCITNLSTGISKAKLSHHEVTVVANTVKQKFQRLVKASIRNILQNI